MWPDGGAAWRRIATFEATIYICVAYLVASVARCSWGIHAPGIVETEGEAQGVTHRLML